MNTLYEYSGPFADLAAGGAGFTTEATSHLLRNFGSVTSSVTTLVDSSEEFVASMNVAQVASTAAERHQAATSATRLLIEASDRTALIPQRQAADTAHVDILDFFTRAGERMISPRTDWRWIANASDTLDFGATG